MRFSARLVVVPLIAAAALLAACGSSNNASTTATAQHAAQTTSSSPTVKTASSSMGTILVDGQGMTLYHLTAEQGGKFICTNSACTAIWHPVSVSAGAKPTGEVEALGVVKRPDGTTQVTYKGEPLYTFAQDQKPGETKGQGFKDVGTWTVITTGAPAPASSSSTSTETSPSSSGEGGGGGGRYGY